MPSSLEQELSWQLRVAGLPTPEREWKFHPQRRWRFDFCWVKQGIAVECEGGTWVNGAHNRGAHFQSDCEKYNSAVLLGYKVLRFTGADIKSGRALAQITAALAGEKFEDVVFG